MVDTDKVRMDALKTPSYKENTINSDSISNNNIITANYYNTKYNYGSAGELNATLQENYILQDNELSELGITFNKFNGQHGYEFKSTENENFVWYGATSTPLWSENEIVNLSTSKYGKDGSVQGYFRPESIKVLPLIKL